MTEFLNKQMPLALAALRIMAGLLYFAHGTQKLFDFPISGPPTLSWLHIASGSLELVLGVLIIVGFHTRLAAFIASGHMAFAYFLSHSPKSFYPVANGGDAAILFCFVFLLLVTTGAGAFSLDKGKR